MTPGVAIPSAGRVDVSVVVEAVNSAAADADGLAGPDIGGCAVDRPGEDAVQAVDRLLVAVVAVGDRQPGAGRNVELEDRDGPVRGVAFDEEPDCELPDPDLFTRCSRHVEPPQGVASGKVA